MKNFTTLLVIVLTFMACSHKANWTSAQKQEFMNHIKQVEKLAYLNNMTVEEFEHYASDLAASIQLLHPDYAVFMDMPGVNDTIVQYGITTYAYYVDSDYRNMRTLYPYRQLVDDGILPDNLTHEQKEAFYACLAAKIRGEYESISFFLGALSYGDKAQQQAVIFQQQCAAELGASVMIEEQITQ